MILNKLSLDRQRTR